MKKDQQCDANNQAGDHATPKPPVTPRLCLIVLGHGATLLPLCPRAKRKWLVRCTRSVPGCSWRSRLENRTRTRAFQWGFVFTLMTLELGLVPLPLYARNR